jgi:hypothetical protein
MTDVILYHGCWHEWVISVELDSGVWQLRMTSFIPLTSVGFAGEAPRDSMAGFSSI